MENVDNFLTHEKIRRGKLFVEKVCAVYFFVEKYIYKIMHTPLNKCLSTENVDKVGLSTMLFGKMWINKVIFLVDNYAK